MPRLIILGTSSAIPSENQDNTHMALAGKNGFVMIDCSGSPNIRLKKAGLDILKLSDLFLTHFHPDHVSGVPSLLMQSWLLGRKEPLNIYGLHHTLDRIERIMTFYEWESWPDFYQVNFHRLPEGEKVVGMENGEFRILVSEVKHHVPGIGLRIELKENGKTIVYSSDTEPSESIVRLAEGADILIHEATGATPGHTSAAQAGKIARKARARHLYLIHYDNGDDEVFVENLLTEARETFPGQVTLARDFMTLEM